jgi:hypothetical protein
MGDASIVVWGRGANDKNDNNNCDNNCYYFKERKL